MVRREATTRAPLNMLDPLALVSALAPALMHGTDLFGGGPAVTLADLSLDQQLSNVIRQQGGWTYMLLALIMFLETGVVILPFLPGDTLLFAVGLVAASGSLDPWLAFSILGVSAVLGDCTGYALGCTFRATFAQGKRIRLINPKHLERTQQFYAKHGAKAIMLARFIPIIRALAPFTAGIAKMPFEQLVKYSIVGSVIWVGSFVSAGYFFGQIPIVKQYFPHVAMGVVGLITLTVIIEVIKQFRAKPQAATVVDAPVQSPESTLSQGPSGDPAAGTLTPPPPPGGDLGGQLPPEAATRPGT